MPRVAYKPLYRTAEYERRITQSKLDQTTKELARLRGILATRGPAVIDAAVSAVQSGLHVNGQLVEPLRLLPLEFECAAAYIDGGAAPEGFEAYWGSRLYSWRGRPLARVGEAR